MNERAFQEFLATGEYVPTMDSDWRDNPFVQMTLEQHDRRFHPIGYKEGDACKVRERLATGDIVDSSIADVVAKAEAEEVVAPPTVAKITKPKKIKLELESMTPEQLRDAAKSLAGYKALMKSEKRDIYGRAHAQAGGEEGVDGKWYEAGEFLPDHEYREFVLKFSTPSNSSDPLATRKAARGEVSIWELLDKREKQAILDGTERPKWDADKNTKNAASSETLNSGWYDIDKLRSDNAIEYFLSRADDYKYFAGWGNGRSGYTEEKARQAIDSLISHYDDFYSRIRPSANAEEKIREHLFNLRKDGVLFVSDLYLKALQKSAALASGMEVEIVMPYKFKWLRHGKWHNSIWFYLPKGTTNEQALDFWKKRHPDYNHEHTTAHGAIPMAHFKDDRFGAASGYIPEYLYNKLPILKLD